MKKKKILLYSLIIFIVIFIVIMLGNLYVIMKTRNKIIDEDKYNTLSDIECIIILGAGIRTNEPSPLLKDRLDKGIELYKLGLAPKIIMSGDHGNPNHDEVNVMKKYAIDKGVPSEDIFMDHAGFSTYDSMYRAKYIFNVKKAIVVTQRYHIYRALYIAEHLGLDYYGVEAEENNKKNAWIRNIREVLARDKDIVKSIIKPRSKYLGETIDISLNGDITNDK